MGEPWFKAKKYGVGIAPAGLAGWVATAISVALIIATRPIVRYFSLPIWVAYVAMGVEVAAFICFASLKSDGDPWRWRWSDHSEP